MEKPPGSTGAFSSLRFEFLSSRVYVTQPHLGMDILMVWAWTHFSNDIEAERMAMVFVIKTWGMWLQEKT